MDKGLNRIMLASAAALALAGCDQGPRGNMTSDQLCQTEFSDAQKADRVADFFDGQNRSATIKWDTTDDIAQAIIDSGCSDNVIDLAENRLMIRGEAIIAYHDVDTARRAIANRRSDFNHPGLPVTQEQN